jgi:hypothetical protein
MLNKVSICITSLTVTVLLSNLIVLLLAADMLS